MFDDGWDDFDAAATLDAAVEFDTEENRAALGKLQATLHFADLHTTLPQTSTVRGGERLVVHGGDGCPAIAEFAPAELGVLLKISSGAAAAYIGEALALRHRLPRIWAKTLNGQAVVWRARAVARACLKLSAEAAALVDERVVAVIDTLSAYRLQKIIDAVIKEADPDAARKAAEDHARQRGVWVQPSDDHGTKTIWVKASSGDVITFDATINDLAWALHKLGDPDPLTERRAKAIGWIADPQAAYELLTAARYLATHPAPATTPPTEANQPPPAPPTANSPAAPTTDPPEAPTETPSGPPTANAPAAPTTDVPGAPAETPFGAPTANALGAPTANPLHDSSDAEPRLPKATAPELPDNSSEADPNRPGEPATVPPDGPADAELHLPGSPTAGLAGDASGVKLHKPGATGAEPGLSGAPRTEPADESSGDEWDLPEVPGEVAEEPDWDAPYPGDGQEPVGPVHCPAGEIRAAIDPYSRHQLAGKLATIKNAAHTPGISSGSGAGRGGRVVLYVHITDETLLSGDGIVRVEDHGAFIAAQLKELLGHDQVVLKPVIDLNEHIDVNAY
ncbi:MAG: hypothetical protein QOH03_5011, partial [Kribbellaceae bacterium]|nr:hypothetical protein [Kribbellaceae bacterium]